MSLVSAQTETAAAGVVGDVELARQAVEIAVFQDVVMHRAGVGHHVDEFAGIEAAGGSGGDVADVVRAGALRGEAEIGEFHQDVRAVFRHDLADLDVGAGGEIGVAGTPVGGDFRQAAELIGAERAAGDAAAEHEAFLRRGDEEQAVELVAEDIAIGGKRCWSRRWRGWCRNNRGRFSRI